MVEIHAPGGVVGKHGPTSEQLTCAQEKREEEGKTW